MRVKHLLELRVCREDRGAERADRALLLEQRRRVQTPPRTGGPDAGSDLEMDMPVRITGPARLVRDGYRFQLLDRHHLLLPSRPNPRNGVLAEPGANLGYRVTLRRIQRLGYFWVQGGGDGEGLGDVHDHLREPRRPPPPIAG